MSVCALVAASDFNPQDFKTRYEAGCFDQIYAVDAGFSYLEELGCAPDLVIGDFDSLGYVPKAKRVVKHPVHKDKSDLELAFDRARLRKFASVFVYGGIGGRLDHTIANLQMAARFAEGGMDVTFITPAEAVRILVGPDAYELPLLEKGVVSVFSATDVSRGVIERGMEYALNDEELTNRTSRGLSNELIGQEAAVAVESGTLYIFHPLA